MLESHPHARNHNCRISILRHAQNYSLELCAVGHPSGTEAQHLSISPVTSTSGRGRCRDKPFSGLLRPDYRPAAFRLQPPDVDGFCAQGLAWRHEAMIKRTESEIF